MEDEFQTTVLTRPRVYLANMLVFTLVVIIIAAILFPQIREAFDANRGLNGLIVFVLLIGIVYAFRMVWRLFPEINWVNSFRIAEPGLEIDHTPRLLGPMATMLRDRQGVTVLSTQSMRSLLDSLASRLDESRDISRYLIGLLIFLGLLGTFWGLLSTVSSFGNVVQQLDVETAESATIFEELKEGLKAPLAGMGTSFSSSLFGLAGSLVLGFLDLQASQAQNRFYNELEDWLSSITDIETSDGNGVSMPRYLRMDVTDLQDGVNQINRKLQGVLSERDQLRQNDHADGESLDRLAGAVTGLVRQMREEQKIMREWAQEQSDQQVEIQRMLSESLKPPARKR